ncbi:MAG TPA: transcriptional regulator CynR [Verrucomicrobiae bacterium]|nr:transcriptional regulator CynR [Verrucomicrobiae bacterium]
MNLALMELRHLRYFVAVAEAAHFTKAAAKLRVTQPTLSHQIRQLEGQLNLALFDRIGRRIKLTAAGELLLPHARRVMRELEEAQTALSELQGLKGGQLRVGIMQTVNACVIPEIVSRFSAAHPGIRVTCSDMAVDDIESGLESGKLDLGISFIPATRSPLEGEHVFSEELVLVARAAHPLMQRRSVKIRELSAVPLVLLSPKYCTRQLIDRAFAEAQVRPEIRVEMNSIESIVATVRQSDLATILPPLALCQREAGLASVPLTDPKPRRSVGLLWLRGAQRRAAAQAFATVAEQALAERRPHGKRPPLDPTSKQLAFG